MKRSPLVALALLIFLNSCDHIDVVGDKVNELKDLRKATTKGMGGQSLEEMLDGAGHDPTIQDLSENQFHTFVSKPGRLNIIEFESADSHYSNSFQTTLAGVVDSNASVARLGRIDIGKSGDLVRTLNVGNLPDVRFFRDGEMVYQFTGAETEETLDNLIKTHSPAVVPSDDLATQLHNGLNGIIGDSIQPKAAKNPPQTHKAKPIEEAMQPMEKEWLPPGISRKK